MHSPYLFQLLTEIHDETLRIPAFARIEEIRASLLSNPKTVSDTDHGAGTRSAGSQKARTIRSLAKTSLSSPAKCRMISRLVARQKPNVMLELGTSLGIMTSYLASAYQGGSLHTIESNQDILDTARHAVHALNINNVRFHFGTFDNVLPGLLDEISPISFVVIDGDHRGSALLRYYHQIKQFLSQDAIVMIDDIRWSADMHDAWNEILRDQDVTCSLDYFSFGLLFFRKEFKENLRLSIRG